MYLRFFKQAATPNKINKQAYLTELGTVSNVILKDETNLMEPIFVLKTNPVVYNANYLFCEFTSRYYYIESIDAMSGGRIAIHCKIDVLYTYRNEILNSTCWVECSDITTDTSDDYDLLHNDYPFREDYDVLGVDITDGTESGSVFNVPEVDEPNERRIVLVIK